MSGSSNRKGGGQTGDAPAEDRNRLGHDGIVGAPAPP